VCVCARASVCTLRVHIHTSAAYEDVGIARLEGDIRDRRAVLEGVDGGPSDSIPESHGMVNAAGHNAGLGFRV